MFVCRNGERHENPLYVKPEELDDIDKGTVATAGEDGISPSKGGAADSNGSG